MKLLHYGFGFFLGGFLVLLGMDRLGHFCGQFHLGARRDREHIKVEVDCTTLVFSLGKYFSHSLQNTKTLVSNHQLHTVQITTS